MTRCQLVTMKILRELFPQYAKETVWRWNTKRGGPYRLPPTDHDIDSRTPVWNVGTILEWGERTGKAKEWDDEVMARLCQ